MAGRPHLIRFEHPDIIICRICETHLGLKQQIIWKSSPRIEEPFVVLTYMINVDLKGEDSRENHVRASVSCKNCYGYVGYHIVKMYFVDMIFLEGRFVVYTPLVLLRSGNELLDAITMDPIRRWDVVRYTRDNNFFVCGQCKSHLAHENVFIHRFADTPQFGLFHTTVVNVHPGSRYYTERDTRQPVYCSLCYTYVGDRIIETGAPDAFIRDGRFILNLRNMLFWGWGKLIDAFTQRPYDPANV